METKRRSPDWDSQLEWEAELNTMHQVARSKKLEKSGRQKPIIGSLGQHAYDIR